MLPKFEIDVQEEIQQVSVLSLVRTPLYQRWLFLIKISINGSVPSISARINKYIGCDSCCMMKNKTARVVKKEQTH